MPTPDLPVVVVLRVPGGDPWTSPSVRIRDVPTSSVIELDVSPAPLERALRDDRPVVATSPRAAAWLAALPPYILRGRVHCSGERTARILATGGWEPIPPRSGSGGEVVAASVLGGDRAGAPLHVRGLDTAGTFEAAMARAGRDVEPLVVYELRERDAFDEAELDALRGCDALAVLAPSCLRVLLRLAPQLARALSRDVPALCGPTTALALREAGWRDVRVAPEPSSAALLPLFLTDPVITGETP